MPCATYSFDIFLKAQWHNRCHMSAQITSFSTFDLSLIPAKAKETEPMLMFLCDIKPPVTGVLHSQYSNLDRFPCYDVIVGTSTTQRRVCYPEIRKWWHFMAMYLKIWDHITRQHQLMFYILLFARFVKRIIADINSTTFKKYAALEVIFAAKFISHT